MKVLVLLTGGICADGITSVWLTYCKEFARQGLLSNQFVVDFGVIDGLSDFSKVDVFNAIGIRMIPLPDRLHTPMKYLTSLVNILKEGHYDIIHANGSSSLMCIEMLAGRLAKIPVRISHSRNSQCSFHVLHILLRPLFFHLCNGRFACGEQAGKWLFKNKNFVIINNGKDFSKFSYSLGKRTQMRENLNLADKIVIGHVGWFTRIKNQSFLIDVFEEFVKLTPNSILYLMGIGDMFEEMKNKIEKKGLEDKVILAGLIENMPDRLHAMDIMALPSLHEGLPNVVLEWQALGLPCLLSDTITKACAVSDLVEYESLEESPKVWAKHLNDMLDKKRNREEDANQGVLALRKAGFDIRDNVKFLYEQYSKLVNRYKTDGTL